MDTVRKGRGEQMRRRHSGGWDTALTSAGSNYVSTRTGGQKGVAETGTCISETNMQFHLISLSPTEKEKFKFTKTRSGRGPESL